MRRPDSTDLEPLVHDPRFIHDVADVSAERLCYLTNRRNSVDFDVIIRDLATGRRDGRVRRRRCRPARGDVAGRPVGRRHAEQPSAQLRPDPARRSDQAGRCRPRLGDHRRRRARAVRRDALHADRRRPARDDGPGPRPDRPRALRPRQRRLVLARHRRGVRRDRLARAGRFRRHRRDERRRRVARGAARCVRRPPSRRRVARRRLRRGAPAAGAALVARRPYGRAVVLRSHRAGRRAAPGRRERRGDRADPVRRPDRRIRPRRAAQHPDPDPRRRGDPVFRLRGRRAARTVWPDRRC